MKKLALLVLSVCSLSGISQTMLPCVDDGFENLSVGTLTSTAWSGSYFYYSGGGGCNGPGAGTYLSSNANVSVVATPVYDGNVNNVTTSPFGGNNVAYIKTDYYTKNRITKTITVTPSNFIYRFAYKASTGGGSCGAGMLQFNFYDCSGNALTAISRSVQTTNVLSSGPDNVFWQASPTYLNEKYSPDWVITSANLSAYVGSCVKVLIEVDPCTCGGHMVTCYYDDMCADQFIMANTTATITTQPEAHLINTNSFLSCANTATLAGLPGFSSYSWQGPSGSGITNATLSAITTTASGIYTLTATSGTNSFTQQVNLTVNHLQNTSILGNTFVCQGNSLTLSAYGAGLNTYSWSTGAASSSITVTPTANITNYVVTTTNAINCAWSASLSVYLIAPPSVSISLPANGVCEGIPASLSASNLYYPSYVWSNGSVLPAISVAPPAGNHVYTLTTTDMHSCTSSTTATLTVLPLPVVQAVALSGTAICQGQSISLGAVGNAVSYSWSGTANLSPPVIVSPLVTTVYSVTGVNAYGCTATSSITIVVNPLPQPQIVGAATVCAGQPVNLSVQGSDIQNYQWSTGSTASSISEAPTLNTAYSVTVASADGCMGNTSQMVTVNALPQIQVVASGSAICEGEGVILTASSNAPVSFVWNTGIAGNMVNDYPASGTFTYVITGTDANGCSSQVSSIVTVSRCLGIATNAAAVTGISIFPNPAGEAFTITGSKPASGQIINSLGQQVSEFNLSAEHGFSTEIRGLAPGVYFVRSSISVTKIIIN